MADDSLYMKSKTVELDRAYERALARMNLKVEYGVFAGEPEDTEMTVPIQVVRAAITVPLPREILASLPLP